MIPLERVKRAWPALGSIRQWLRNLSTLLRFREASVALAFLLLCFFFWWRKPDVFLKPANLAVIMRFIATFGMLAMGEVLVIITRGIDLSVGSLTALTGVITAWLILKGVGGLLPPIGIVPAILIVLTLGALVGIWHGLFVIKSRIEMHKSVSVFVLVAEVQR